MKQSPPVLLRPVHAWFFGWERIAPYIYRVAAVATGALITSGALLIIGVEPLIAIPVVLAGWIALAVAQEHDERVHLPVDATFLRDLRLKIDPLLSPHGLSFNSSHGPCRARSDRTETFLYEKADLDEVCIDLWIHRNIEEGTMEVVYGRHDLSESLVEVGNVSLARRITSTKSPSDDVDALVGGFSEVPSTFWDDP